MSATRSLVDFITANRSLYDYIDNYEGEITDEANAHFKEQISKLNNDGTNATDACFRFIAGFDYSLADIEKEIECWKMEYNRVAKVRDRAKFFIGHLVKSAPDVKFSCPRGTMFFQKRTTNELVLDFETARISSSHVIPNEIIDKNPTLASFCERVEFYKLKSKELIEALKGDESGAVSTIPGANLNLKQQDIFVMREKSQHPELKTITENRGE